MTMENEAYIRASSHFLCNELPKDWYTLSKEDLYDFVNDEVWQPFEGRSTAYVWAQIENLALDFISFARKHTNKK